MATAEQQREYRRRKGARVGGRRGPAPTAPCGTPSAYLRHYRNGEPIDDACRDAYNAHHRELDKAKRAARRDA